MAEVAFSPRALEDLERIFEFYADNDPQLALHQIDAVRTAVSALAAHPLIGRLVDQGLRELVISRGRTGFVALYRFTSPPERVSLLRIRHQRELGYPQG